MDTLLVDVGVSFLFLSALVGRKKSLVIRFQAEGESIIFALKSGDRLDLETKGHEVREGLKGGYMHH